MTKSKIRTFFTNWPASKIAAVLVALIIMAAGTYWLVTKAAGFFAAFEPENSTISHNAKVVTDSGAIGGKAIQFTAPPSQEPPQPPPNNPPTGLKECPPFPAFPDEKCTGYKPTTGYTSDTQLNHSCDEGDGDNDGHLHKANAVYDKCFFDFVRVWAPNVTIKNSKILGNVYSPNGGSAERDFQGLKLINVEISPFTDADIANNRNVDVGSQAPIEDAANYECLRCYIHRGAKSVGGTSNVVIKDSFVNGITGSAGQHGAAVGMASGNNIQIIHNNLECYRWNVGGGVVSGCSSALSLYDEPKISNVLVKNNLFNTTGGYCVYGGGPNGTGIQFIDNYFGKKYGPNCGAIYGAVAAFHRNTGNVWSGNVWADGSGVVNP